MIRQSYNLICSLLFLFLLVPVAALAAGGDFISPFPVIDVKGGKQEAKASVVDPDGNIIVTGYQNLTGNSNDDTFYTVKFTSTGSGGIGNSGILWTKTYAKDPGVNRATAVVVDSDKNVIVTGYAWNATLLKQQLQTIKYDGTNGNVLWQATYSASSTSTDYATCITVDSLNNVYVGGYTNAGTTLEDFFVLQYSSNGPQPDGSPVWKVFYNGTANKTDKLTAIAAGAGGIAVTGYSSNGTNFDILTLKYDYVGNKLREWRKSGTSADAWGKFVKLDNAGNVTMTGFSSNGSNKDIYTAKYNAATGAIIWEQTYNGLDNLDDEPGGLYLDSAGDAYVAGTTMTVANNQDFYTVKYHDTGSGTTPETVWGKTFNSANGNNDSATGIIGDKIGNIYVVGTSVAAARYNTQTLKYKASDGTLFWNRIHDDTNSREEVPSGIGLSSSDNVYIGGWVEQETAGDYDFFSAQFDPGLINTPTNLVLSELAKSEATGKYSVTITWDDNSPGANDGFVVERKVGAAGAYDTSWTLNQPTANTFTDTGLNEGNYYYYRVKTFKAGIGDSHYTEPELRVLTLIITPVPEVWSYLYNGVYNNNDFATAIAVGSDNHPVVTGYSFDYAPGYTDGTISTDYVTVKLNNESGEFIWKDQFEGGFNQEDNALGVAMDSNNDVVVTGNSIQYVTGVGNINSIYTMKYNAAAPVTVQWGAQYNGGGGIDDRARAVATSSDASRNIVVAGYGENATDSDIYIIKYGPAAPAEGEKKLPLWSAVYASGSGRNDLPSTVAFDKDGNVVVTGYSETASGSGVYSTFTAKYCGVTGAASCGGVLQGQIIWSDTYAGNGDNKAFSLAIDNDNNVYVSGYEVNVGTGKDFLTIKYDGKKVPTADRRIWVRTSDGDANGNDIAATVLVDPIDNAAIVGGTVLTSTDNNDFRIIRYLSNGGDAWTKTYLRPSNNDEMNAMALDISGNIFATGHTDNDSMTVKYGYNGTLLGTTVYSRPLVNDVDESVAITVNSLGEAFVAGYSKNAAGNDDYMVYKVAGISLQSPSSFTVTPNYTIASISFNDNSLVEDGFHLQRKNGACGDTNTNSWIELPDITPPSPHTTIPKTMNYTDPTVLTIGNSYCYRLQAYRANGEETRWIERTVTMQTPPVPTGFNAAAPNTTTVTLGWNDTVTNETGFEIERCEGSGCTFAEDDTTLTKFNAAVNATSYTDSSVCADKTYRYRILAYKTNSAGTGNEWQSAFAVLTTPVSGAITTPAILVPGSPTITALNESQIRLNWTNTSSDETGYKIYECVAGDCGTLNLAGTTAADATTFTHAGLVPNSTHKYVIKAFKTAAQSCNGGWESNPSNEVSTTTVNTPPTLTATKINSTRIDLAWTETTAAATGFELQKCTSGDCTLDEHFTSFPIIAQHVVASTDAAVCQGTTYKYRVRAINQGLSFAGTAGTWAKRVPVAITDFQQNFQTKVTITKANYPEMRADYADIRFYDDTAKTELSYWIESSTASSATVWIKTSLYNNVYMYYGNAAADVASASSSSTVLDFFDDFNGTSLGSVWNKSSSGLATITVADGTLSIDATANANKLNYANINKALTPPYIAEMRVNNTSDYLASGLIRNRLLTSPAPGDNGIHGASGSVLQAVFNSSYTGKQVPSNQYVRVRAVHSGGATNTWSIYKEDGTQIYLGTFTGTPWGLDISIGDGGGGNGKAIIDWVLVRKYAAVEPSATAGTIPENWGTTFSNTWTGAWSNLATRATDAAVIPSGAVASRVSEAELKVTLNYAFTDVTGIKVDRCTDSSCTAVAKALEGAPGATSVNDNTGLLPDTTYYYLVHAYKTAACGWDTDTSPITPPAARVIISATTTLLAPVINATATPSISTTCNDLRLAATSDGSSPLSYWLENCNSTATKVWLKYSSLPAGATNIYMFLANPTAASPTLLDPNTLFDFFDDFTGTTINTGKWNVVGSYYTQNNELISNGGSGSWNTGVYSVANFTRPFIFEINEKFISGGTETMVGAKNNGTGINYYDFTYALYHTGNINLTPYEGGTGRGQVGTISLNTWYTFKLEALATGAKYYMAPLSTGQFTKYYDSTYSSESPLRIGFGNVNRLFSLDNARVRRYANPEPTAVLAAEDIGSFLTGGAWAVRQQFTITNSAGGALANYQVPFVIDTTSLASDQVAISWTPKSSSETQYIVERCTGTCSPFTVNDTISGIAPGTSSYADRTVSPGTRYCYRVKSDRTSAPLWTSPVSGEACATTLALPTKPTLAVEPHETAMNLSWNDTATGENTYVITRCTGVGCDINSPTQTFTVPANQTAYVDTTVCGDTYSYQVKAVKFGSHAWESPLSDAVTKSTVVPAAPILASATRVSENQINLVWQDKTGDETGFEIERCEGLGCDFSTKTILLAPTSSGVDATVNYSDIGLKPNIIYRYRVRAYKTGNPCGWPSAFSADVREAQTSVLIPTTLTETAVNSTQATLNWTDTTVGESGFAVQRCSGFGCSNFADIGAQIGANAITYNDTSVCANTFYNYQIKAINTLATLSNGNGACWSSRAPLTITDFKANALVKVTISYDADMQADFRDIRFVDSAANAELPYWIESKTNSSSANVWFKSGANNAVYLYFGNSATTSSSSVTNVFGSGLVGYWPFIENAGTYANGSITYDYSGNGKNGILNNFYSSNGIVASGKYGNGLSLNSSPGNMNVSIADSTGSVLDITDQITVEFWYQYQKSPDWARVVSKPTTDGDQPWDTYAVWMDNATDAVTTNPQQKIYFGIGSQDSPPKGAWPYLQSGAGPRLTPGQWYHVAGRYDSTTGRMSIFVNGVEYGVVTHAAKPKIFVNNASLYIGNRSTWNATNGILDEVRVFNRALSDDEIASRYAATLPSVAVGAKTKPGGGCTQNLFDGAYSATGTLVTPVIGNMLGNSDFEVSGSWGYNGTYTGYDSTTPMSGMRSMRVKKSVGKNSTELMTQGLPKLTPGGNYQLSGYVNTNLHNGQAYCRIQDSSGGNPAWDLNTTSGWPEFNIQFDPVMYTWVKRDNTIPANSDAASTAGRIPLGSALTIGDGSWVQSQAVILDNGTYKTWYTGNADNGIWRIYYATSPDGLTWTKQDNTLPAASDTTGTNGRIPIGTTGKGDVSGTYASPSVILDGGTYKMWYSGSDGTKWRIYYATSPDGLTWTKYDNSSPADSNTSGTSGRIPVGLVGSGDVSGTFAPSVIKDGSTYKMWYSGYDGTKWRIYYATSGDGLSWTKLDNSIPTDSDSSGTSGTSGRIPLGLAGTGDAIHARQPSVVFDGLTYRMWYSGHNGSNWRSYYATSPDGLAWTKYDNSSPATTSNSSGTNGRLPAGTTGRGDSNDVFAPSVVFDGTTYRQWYTGMDSGGNRRIFLATSADGLAWSKQDNTFQNPSDTTGTNGRIPLGAKRGDLRHTLGQNVIIDGSYKMWYSGNDGINWRMYYATSADGITWTKQDNTIPPVSDSSSTNGRIPVGSTGKGDSVHVFTSSSIIKDTDELNPNYRYKIWYGGQDGSSIWRIYYATSPDGLTWTKYDNSIPANSDSSSTGGRLPLGVAGKGDSAGVYAQAVIKDGSTFKMWYAGLDDNATVTNRRWRIYHATSTDGGLTWVKKDNTIPGVSNSTSTNGRIPLGGAGTGDVNAVIAPTVIKDGTVYKMWYSGSDTSNVWRTFYAFSTDGLNWTKYDNTIPAISDGSSINGRIPLGNTGRGDSVHAYVPSVIKDGSNYRMWYSGYDGNSYYRIYSATLTPNSNYNDQRWHAFNVPMTIKSSIDGTGLSVVCGFYRSSADTAPDGESSAWFDMIQFVPMPPISLTATAGTESMVNLAWSDYINDETGYKIERCNLATCADSDFVQVGSDLPANTYSYIDSVPTLGVKYTYRVKAFKTAGCPWNAVSNTPSLTPVSLAPTGLAASAANTTQINLSWNYAAGYETGFIIERCSGTTCTDFLPLAAKALPGASSFSDTTVCNGQTYRYQIRSYKDGLSQGGGGCGWIRMKELTVSNFIPAFPIRYTVTYDSDMKADFSDLRFFDPVSNTELPHWIETYNASNATVWIKTGTSETINMYYGNGDAGVVSNSNGSRVFDFFDSFDGTVIDTSNRWTVLSPDNIFSQNNELLTGITPNYWTNGIYSKTAFTRPFVFEANVYYESDSTGTLLFGIKSNDSLVGFYDYVYNFETYGAPNVTVRLRGKGNYYGDYGTIPTNAYKFFRIDALSPAGARYYFGDSSSTAVNKFENTTYSDSPVKIGFTSTSRKVKIDNVRIRRYAATEPSVSATGTEQELTCTNASPGLVTGPASTASTAVTTPVWVKPSGMIATPITDTQVNLSWTRNTTDETGFTIQRCTNDGCSDFSTVGTTANGVTTFSNSPLSVSTTYCYQVKAYKTASCSWDTDYSVQTAQSCNRSLPEQTGNTLIATPINSRAIHLNWSDPATDEDGYEIETLAWHGRWVYVAKVDANTTSYNHTQSLEPGQKYSYRVRPYRGLYTSPYSNVATATTPSFSSSPPTCP